MRSRIVLLVSFFLTSFILVAAQQYELQWDDLAVPVHVPTPSPAPPAVAVKPKGQTPIKSCTKNCSTWRNVPPELRRQIWPNRSEETEYSEPVDIEFQISQDFDYYRNRYRLIKDVESWTYRGTYPQYYRQLDDGDRTDFVLYLNDLERGNKFKVRVTWDDGSHKTIEQTLGDTPQLSYYITEPDYLEY